MSTGIESKPALDSWDLDEEISLSTASGKLSSWLKAAVATSPFKYPAILLALIALLHYITNKIKNTNMNIQAGYKLHWRQSERIVRCATAIPRIKLEKEIEAWDIIVLE